MTVSAKQRNFAGETLTNHNHSLRMKKSTIALCLAMLFPSLAKAQDADRKWGLQFSLGGTEMNNSGSTMNEDQGNAFALTADWYAWRHLALTGGIYTEHTGVFTGLDADGLGPKTFNTLGVMAGAKLYPLPVRWIMQPYLGGALYTNVLNLGHNRGKFQFTSNYTGEPSTTADYDIRCSALSLSPQVGIDIRLVSSVSLGVAADYRWSLGGKTQATARITEGQLAGRTFTLDERHDRLVFSVGLKVDFPLRSYNHDRLSNTLWSLLAGWIEGKAGR